LARNQKSFSPLQEEISDEAMDNSMIPELIPLNTDPSNAEFEDGSAKEMQAAVSLRSASKDSPHGQPILSATPFSRVNGSNLVRK